MPRILPCLFRIMTDRNRLLYSWNRAQPDWMSTREFWDRSFEAKYEALMKNTSRPPLRVIVVPHSHNDPGWLKTFVNYFESDSKTILNHIVTKLQEYEDMTFIWSEISILQMWWDQAHPSKQRVSWVKVAFKWLENNEWKDCYKMGFCFPIKKVNNCGLSSFCDKNNFIIIYYTIVKS